MTDFNSPVQVEEAIREVSNRIAKSVQICADRYAAYLTAERDYDRAYALAYMHHDGPAHEKRYAAELETFKEREVNIAKWILVGWEIVGALATVYMVGRPREPMTGGVAALSLLFVAAAIWLVVIA